MQREALADALHKTASESTAGQAARHSREIYFSSHRKGLDTRRDPVPAAARMNALNLNHLGLNIQVQMRKFEWLASDLVRQ